MALFNRNSNESNQPTSLEQYYATQRRSNVASWVLTAGVFIGSVLIVLGLVFGGRYAYRQIVDNDDQIPPVSQQESDESTNQEQSTVTDKQDDSGSNSGTTTTPSTPAPSQPNPAPAIPAPTPSPSPTPAPQPQTLPRPTPTTPSTPATGSAQPAQLPNSGPENLPGIFVVISLLAAALHHVHSRFKLRSANNG